MTTRPHPIDFQGLLRATERRLTAQERRPHPSVASDLLGPGIGPTAVEISDWNSEVIGFNGFFFSQPGAINSPSALVSWMGYSIADPNGIGFQRVTAYRDPASEGTSNLYPAWPGPSYSRAFYSADGSSRSYSPWRTDLTGTAVEVDGTGGTVTITGTSFTLLPTLFIDLTVTATTQVFWVTAMVDVAHGDTSPQLFTARLVADGTPLPVTLHYAAQAINNFRTTLTGRWKVTGMPVGTRRVQVEAALDAPGNYVVRTGNSSISAESAS